MLILSAAVDDYGNNRKLKGLALALDAPSIPAPSGLIIVWRLASYGTSLPFSHQ